ncbi:MAG: tRNA (adenosine(37)-N6)-threonylcarbamoyltransferase complex dimerization subunit type 1 TsaB [Planctomycetales bacterium]|nr:tRNA (adenosine(37)-N6)-threonylcarbamoyltransferase complex dimerization subunit type 1 TsaB [Planctomycetales bacterium]
MLVLALDTSTRQGSLAAFEATGTQLELVHYSKLPDNQSTAQSLVPEIQALLQACGWSIDKLGLVCTTSGPGSFTGLRLGVTTAKTLAYATGAQLVATPTLSAIAANVATAPLRLWAILDAQRQQLFAACFAKGWQTKTEKPPKTQVLTIDDWLSQLRPGDLVVGPPLTKLRLGLPTDVNIADPQKWSPQATTTGRLGFAEFLRGNTIDPMQLIPAYCRKSAAEEKAEKND